MAGMDTTLNYACPKERLCGRTMASEKRDRGISTIKRLIQQTRM